MVRLQKNDQKVTVWNWWRMFWSFHYEPRWTTTLFLHDTWEGRGERAKWEMGQRSSPPSPCSPFIGEVAGEIFILSLDRLIFKNSPCKLQMSPNHSQMSLRLSNWALNILMGSLTYTLSLVCSIFSLANLCLHCLFFRLCPLKGIWYWTLMSIWITRRCYLFQAFMDEVIICFGIFPLLLWLVSTNCVNLLGEWPLYRYNYRIVWRPLIRVVFCLPSSSCNCLNRLDSVTTFLLKVFSFWKGSY